MARITVSGTLSAAVADAGTFTVSYPAPPAPEIGVTDEGDFYNAMEHALVIGQNDAYAFPQDFDITLGTANITVTNEAGTTWPAGSTYQLELNMQGKNAYSPDGVRLARTARSDTYIVELGSPDALVTNGVMAAQNRTNAGALLVNGTLASGGTVTLDKPRNLIADSGGVDTAVITVTGVDEYGATMSEAITLNGTTAVAGKKAFKKITALSCDAAIANTAFIGTGDVLGLPFFLPSNGHVIKELQNGTAATAGTFVAGLRAAEGSTTTSADVRGTYDANAALDGALTLQLIVSLPDGGFLGCPQA
jgi:hypothetical protein